jgi:hypothetical protein
MKIRDLLKILSRPVISIGLPLNMLIDCARNCAHNLKLFPKNITICQHS